jgi:hypothetical protein
LDLAFFEYALSCDHRHGLYDMFHEYSTVRTSSVHGGGSQVRTRTHSTAYVLYVQHVRCMNGKSHMSSLFKLPWAQMIHVSRTLQSTSYGRKKRLVASLPVAHKLTPDLLTVSFVPVLFLYC